MTVTEGNFNRQLTWQCAQCRKAIPDHGGTLRVSIQAAQSAIDERTSARPRRLAEHRTSVFIEEIMAGPDDVHWLAICDECGGGDCPEPSYEIGVESIRTWRQVARWCGHLAGKPWIDGTDWFQLVLLISEPEVA